VRVIAATHQDLEQRVKEGVFREDLFHRLNVIRLRLPALRERREDIPDAGAALPAAKRQAARASSPSAFPMRRCERLTTFAFPGNVRQLENICHWLTVMAPAQLIEPKDLPPEVGAGRRDPSLARGRRRRGVPLGGRRRPHERRAVAAVRARCAAGGWESALEAEARNCWPAAATTCGTRSRSASNRS
jgi:two-component system nitrogen regulation response regulator GlnG